MDILLIESKICCMVDFILKQDPGYFIFDKGRGLNSIFVFQEEVSIEATLHNTEHEEGAALHCSVTSDKPPEPLRIGVVVVFGGGFLVFAVPGLKDAFSPGVAMPPVETAGNGEIGIFVAGVCNLGIEKLEIGL